MCKVSKISTKGMSREDWLSHRLKSIGGSDAAALLGLNKYKSPYALWAEKTGVIEVDDLTDKEAVRLGNDLEQYVAERWMEATGKKLRRENNILYNAEYPFAHANIDRAVVGEPDAGFEAKTSSSYDILKACKEGRVPEHFYVQCCHYMMVTGAKRWYIGILVFGHGFFHFVIERDEDEIAALAAAETAFWQRVQDGTPPDADGDPSTMAALKTIYSNSVDEVADIHHMEGDLRIITEAEAQIKELERTADAAKARIMAEMGESAQGIATGFRVSWKSQVRSTFDKKAYERDHGRIPDEYYKKSTSRPFKVSAI